MKKIARKYFLPILLGSVLIFAIDMAEVNASTAIPMNIQNVTQSSSFVKLEDKGFWSKFRESVMKDKDKDNVNPEYSENAPEQPKKDTVHKPAKPITQPPHSRSK